MACQLELEVAQGATADEFVVRVVQAVTGGRPTATMRLDTDALLAASDALQDTVLASAVAARRTLSLGEQRLRDIGQQLFDAVFSGDVEDAYRSSSSVAFERGQKLRVVLRLAVPKLAGFPWEAMYDRQTDEYVCLKEPLVRHVEARYTPDPLTVEPPLRVLGLVASPRTMADLDVTVERDRLMEALKGPIGAGMIEVDWLMQASWEAVHDKLLSDTWHVLHFIGHGDYDLNSDQGVIALVGANGRPHLVGADRLADLLDQASPTPRLVVLNSCESGRSGGRDLFSSTAATLVRSGISAVAAMQFTVSDPAAIAFSRGFYSALASGRSIDEAARSGRIGILGAPGTLEWVTPVLYVRGDTTQLFNLKPVRSQTSSRIAPLYNEGLAALAAGHFEEALQRFDAVLNLDPGYRDASALREEAARRHSYGGTRAAAGAVTPARDDQPTPAARGDAADAPVVSAAREVRQKQRWGRRRSVLIAAAVSALIAVVGVAITVGVVYNDGERRSLFRGYIMNERGVEVRAEPKLSSHPVGYLPFNTAVFIACTAIGDMVQGPGAGGGPPTSTPLWNKVRTDHDGSDLGFVPDAWVKTGTTEPKGPPC